MLRPPDVESIIRQARAGNRLSPEEALILARDGELHDLGSLAQVNRYRHNPTEIVTFLIDRNINYTNVCNSDCSFCGFYRHDPQHPESYVLSRDAIGGKIEEALALGATRILMQGGHNDELPYDYYINLVAWIHENFRIEINAFSPSEIQQMQKVSAKSYEDILKELQQAGMRGLPGGGAEILDDEVRRWVSPKKIKAEEWIEVMAVAQSLGLTTTASMVIGFGESLENRINHLLRLRNLQDRSRARGYEGFIAFISWTLQHNENTSLGRSRNRENYGASGLEYLRNVAISRIFLDNIPHHQASWPTLGTHVAQIALHFGCDDSGSTMMEENVVSQAGALTKQQWSKSPEELILNIREAGFVPAQRNTAYDILRKFER